MNIEATKKFMDGKKDEIINTFMYYQMIEMMLFMKLYFPDIPKEDGRKDYLKKSNKDFNSKTLGGIKNKYLKKFPNDDYDLISILETVTKERNMFMHGFWMFLALMEDEKRNSTGEMILDQYEKNAGSLLDKINDIPT